ncbi:MAG TPA: ASKHA domain-containing protein, partial [Anaerolineales bacterium]|nr:ASKHA domain-containing protein [Anaerolineales bacterium]
ACLAYFGFDRATEPMLAIDLGTNGEVMATNGRDILVASTAAGPAFEGVNISCGTRAVDGAIVDAKIDDGHLRLTTIGNRHPVGLTGSGLLSVVYALKCAGAVEVSGRLVDDHRAIPVEEGEDEIMQVRLGDRVALTQIDVRELQKAKAAIRVAADIALERLRVKPQDLHRVILTGAFGSQLNIEAVLGVGLIPPDVDRSRIELIPNGAGLGAAMFLRDEGFKVGEELATRAAHIELDLEPEFNMRFVESMGLE